MAHSVEFKHSARKELADLPQDIHARVLRAVLALSDDPRPAGCKKLQAADLWRIRVGRYRIVYEIKDDALVVLVITIAHRREAYRAL